MFDVVISLLCVDTSIILASQHLFYGSVQNSSLRQYSEL